MADLAELLRSQDELRAQGSVLYAAKILRTEMISPSSLRAHDSSGLRLYATVGLHLNTSDPGILQNKYSSADIYSHAKTRIL